MKTIFQFSISKMLFFSIVGVLLCFSQHMYAQCIDTSPTGDCDGDTVLNGIDLDDDNDGILDTDEGLQLSCTYSPVSYAVTNIANGASQFDPGPVTTCCGTNDDWTTFPNGNLFPGGPIFLTGSSAIQGTIVGTYDIVFDGSNRTEISLAIGNIDFSSMEISNQNGDPLTITLISGDPDVLITGNVIQDGDTSDFSNGESATGIFLLQGQFTSLQVTHRTVTGNTDGFYFSFAQSSCTESTIDTDNDGTPNHLDLDSDNDGCSDAFEAGTITTEVSDITVAPFDANVGANGFEDSLETAAESGLYNSTYTYERTTDGGSWCDDNDNDNIPDFADLDDDNDGILDTDENNRTNLIADGGFVNTTTTAAQAAGFTFGANASVGNFNLGSTGGLFDTIGATDGSGGVNIATNGTAPAVTINLGQLLGNRYQVAFDVESNSATPVAGPLLVTVFNTTTNTVAEQIFNATLNGFAPLNAPQTVERAFNVPLGSTDLFELRFHGLGTGNQPADYRLDRIAVVVEGVDTDEDGIVDRLDLDSDNDGCPDYVEGTGSFTEAANGVTADGTLSDGNGNTVDTNLGNTVETVDPTLLGVPVIAGSGQGIGSSSNNAIENCTDTDDDGVPNFADLDDDNDGILDTVECQPQLITGESVGTFGTITSGTRDLQTPPSSSYTYSEVRSSGTGTYAIFAGNYDGWLNSFYNNVVGHTTGSQDDAYLAVNGSTAVGVFYAQNLVLDANTDYQIGVWGLNAVPPAQAARFPCEIGIRIRNSIGNIIETASTGVISVGHVWQEAVATLNTGTETSFTVEVINLSIGSSGNDFAIDDISVISLSPQCSDTDNDGTPNHLDLDSDNDGCSDAFEAGTITTEVADITVAPFDATNVGANGFEDTLETAAESGLYIGTYTYDRATDGNSWCDDNDNDNIPDFADLDDDNDGILDTVESIGPETLLGFFQSNGTPGFGGGAPFIGSRTPVVFNNISTTLAGGGSAVTFTSTLESNLASAITAETYAEYVFTTTDAATFPFMSNLVSFGFIENGGPSIDYDVSVQISTDGFATSTVLGATTVGDTPLGQSLEIVDSPDFQVIPNTTYTVRVYIFNEGPPNPGSETVYGQFHLIFVGELDTDNDSIPNRLDLDSDDDGCSDAFEAGTITTEVADITVAPFDATNVGANGFEDSLETAAESGLYNGTYTYDRATDGGSWCEDNDNDNIPDFVDLDDDNDGILDTVEWISASVNWDEDTSEDGQINGILLGNNGDNLGIVSVTTTNHQVNEGAKRDKDWSSVTGTDGVINVSDIITEGAIVGVNNPNTPSGLILENTINLPVTLVDPILLFDAAEDMTIDFSAINPSGIQLLDASAGGTASVSGNTIAVTGFTTQNAGSFAIQLSGEFNNIVYTGNSTFNVLNSATQIMQISGTYHVDTDNDGTPNYLDLDSDNDGCSDAFEAGTITTEVADITVAPFSANVGDNGFENTIETDDTASATYDNGGTTDYTYNFVIDSNITACQDTDGDGIEDGEEITNGTDETNPCDPLQAAGYTGYDETNGIWSAADCDGDGVTNGTELTNGTDPYDADSDGDGNNDNDDPDPLTATATADTADATSGNAQTVNVLANDDYLGNDDTDNLGTTTLIDTGNGSASGTVSLDPATGELTYTPTSAEANSAVTVEYQVCNDESGTAVCATAIVTFTVTDPDDDGDGVPNSTDSDPNDPCLPLQAAGYTGYDETNGIWSAADCDGDGVTNGTELTNGTDPYDADSDGDGNNDNDDPDPLTATATADTADATSGNAQTVNVLANDDYLGNDDTDNLGTTTLIDTGNGSASGTVSLDPATGELTYTPTSAEANSAVTVEYQVCNDESGTAVCATAIVTFTVTDPDDDGDGVPNSTDSDPNDPCLPLQAAGYTGYDETNGIWAAADCDGDGVTNGTELTNGTDPYNSSDTDGDGISDEQELLDNTDPLNDCDSVGGQPLDDSDCDNDGLTNAEEATLGTNPLNDDTDGDGILDGQEFNDGTNPMDDCDSIGGQPLDESDCDNDGLTNAEELAQGTDPLDVDTDGDGIFDGDEVNQNTDPINPCDPMQAEGYMGYDSTNSIWAAADCDDDGFTNGEEVTAGTDPYSAEATSIEVIEGFTPNGDGINDTWVIENILDYPNSKVQIFNRWGHEIFSAVGYQNNWGAIYKQNPEKVPPGSYYYVINLEDGSTPINGWIFINY